MKIISKALIRKDIISLKKIFIFSIITLIIMRLDLNKYIPGSNIEQSMYKLYIGAGIPNLLINFSDVLYYILVSIVNILPALYIIIKDKVYFEDMVFTRVSKSKWLFNKAMIYVLYSTLFYIVATIIYISSLKVFPSAYEYLYVLKLILYNLSIILLFNIALNPIIILLALVFTPFCMNVSILYILALFIMLAIFERRFL